MGHRRERFWPKRRSKIRSQIQESINKNKFETAATIAAYSYSRRPIADDFAISFIASVEAIKIGQQENWIRKSEELASIGLEIAETKVEGRVNPRRRRTLLDAIAKSIEKVKEEASFIE